MCSSELNLKERLDQLVDFTRPLGLRPKTAEPVAVVMKAVGKIKQQCERQGIKIESDIADGLPSVSLDADRLQEAVLNLLINACEAMPDGGFIHVDVRSDKKKESIQIEIRDSGLGVSPDHIKHVGQPFFTTKPGGVGLGAAIAKRIVGAQGGTIRFESKPGKGFKSILSLPVSAKRV